MAGLTMDPDDPHPPMSDQSAAAVKQIAHTGAKSFQIRYCEEEVPIVWIAVAEYELGDQTAYKLGVALTPDQSILNLLDDVMDGGLCMHCHRPVGVDTEHSEEMPLSDVICWYQYDPELKKFRRSCEGDT